MRNSTALSFAGAINLNPGAEITTLLRLIHVSSPILLEEQMDRSCEFSILEDALVVFCSVCISVLMTALFVHPSATVFSCAGRYRSESWHF